LESSQNWGLDGLLWTFSKKEALKQKLAVFSRPRTDLVLSTPTSTGIHLGGGGVLSDLLCNLVYFKQNMRKARLFGYLVKSEDSVNEYKCI
jgi:hypothetical protein